MRKFLLAITIFSVSCKSSKVSCDAYSMSWSNEADSLEVTRDDKVYIPKIPTRESKQFHMNYPEKGDYKICLYSKGEIVEVKKFTVQ